MPPEVGGYVISQFPLLDTCCHASPDIMDFLYGTLSQNQLFLHKPLVVMVFYYTQQQKVTRISSPTVWSDF